MNEPLSGGERGNEIPPEKLPLEAGRRKRAHTTQIILFVLTVLTTLISGASFSVPFDEMVRNPLVLYKGIPFSFSLLSILLAHEMGHYLMSRRYRVEVTLPYFIPAPTIFGTLGAVIKMRSPVRKKAALFDIGAAGPLCGIIVALPLVMWGLSRSQFIESPIGESSYLVFGDSLLFKALSVLIMGKTPDGFDILLDPIAFAGWVGFLVTSLNLMPMGQLDGGHITYAVFGKKHRLFSRGFIAFLVLMGVLFYSGWLVWAILILILGVDHPPVWDDDIPLDRNRKILAFVVLGIFILTFIPSPVDMDLF